MYVACIVFNDKIVASAAGFFVVFVLGMIIVQLSE